MIKWLIIAVLVAGSFGIIWTAPWKSDVDRLRQRVDDSLSAIDRTTSGECSAYGRQVPQAVRDAVTEIEKDGTGNAELRSRARHQADAIGRCVRQVPNLAPSWGDIESRLRSAAGS